MAVVCGSKGLIARGDDVVPRQCHGCDLGIGIAFARLNRSLQAEQFSGAVLIESEPGERVEQVQRIEQQAMSERRLLRSGLQRIIGAASNHLGHDDGG